MSNARVPGLKRAGLILLLLLAGIGLILALIGAVLGMALAQSLGYFNFSGESRFSLEHWSAQVESGDLWASVRYSLKIAFVSNTASRWSFPKAPPMAI